MALHNAEDENAGCKGRGLTELRKSFKPSRSQAGKEKTESTRENVQKKA